MCKKVKNFLLGNLSIFPIMIYVTALTMFECNFAIWVLFLTSFAFTQQGCTSPTKALSSTPCPYLSTSLSRFDSVKRRQIIRMRKRSNWFLSPNTSYDSRSALGSYEAASCGISSMDPASSDVTTSDGGMSDVPTSDAIRLSSDLDCPFLEHIADDGSSSFHATTDPLHRRLQNESASASSSTAAPPMTAARDISDNRGMARNSLREQVEHRRPSAVATSVAGGSHSPSTQVKESKRHEATRYFLVENFYGHQTESWDLHRSRSFRMPHLSNTSLRRYSLCTCTLPNDACAVVVNIL